MERTPWAIAKLLSLSLALEPSAYPKPGNVHRLRDLPGLRYEYFLATSIVAVEYLYRGVMRGINGYKVKTLFGDLIYATLRETMNLTGGANTCLGSMLLLAPLSVELGYMYKDKLGIEITDEAIKEYTRKVLKQATIGDTIWFYMAVRSASPSYIKPGDDTGEYVNVWDPQFREKIIKRRQGFYETIEYSSRRDIVARELLEGYPRSLDASSFLEERLSSHRDWNRGVVETYLYILSRNIDTVVSRTHGLDTAEEASLEASNTLNEILDVEGDEWFKLVMKLDERFYEKDIKPVAVADLTVSTIAFYLLKHLKIG